jgi:hypothetical protein
MRLCGIILIGLIVTISLGQADEYVLTVQEYGKKEVKQFTEKDIRTFKTTIFATNDPWDNKKRTYKGCLVSELLKQAGLNQSFTTLEVIAKNKYKATITQKELDRYNHTLSYEMDGKDYSVLGDENKGPLAIAVEMEQVKKADKLKVKNQLVWWVEKIIIKP